MEGIGAIDIEGNRSEDEYFIDPRQNREEREY